MTTDQMRALGRRFFESQDERKGGADPALCAADYQAQINGMLLEGPGVVETVKCVGSPIHMADAPVTIRVPPATLGQHTQEVLAEVAQARATAAE